jgi:hypothetical protein
MIKLKLPAAPLKRDLRFAPTSCRESSKCKEVIPFYCSSLANPAARLVDELKSRRYGECARCSIFNLTHDFTLAMLILLA